MIETWELVRIIAFVAGLFSIFSSIELLSVKKMYTDGGFMSRKVTRIYLEYLPLTRAVRPFLTRFPYVLMARITLGAVLMALAVADYLTVIVLVPLFFTDVLIQLRHHGGLSGAFDMGLVVNGGLLVALAFPGSEFVTAAALVFIAVQGLLSYSIAGIAKLIGEEWRNGKAVEMIFSTSSWGDDRVYRLIQRYPQTKIVAAWTVIAFECLFPIVLFLDPPLMLLVFAGGFVFHMANAALMGINSFIFIFPGSYPAIYFTGELVQSALF